MVGAKCGAELLDHPLNGEVNVYLMPKTIITIFRFLKPDMITKSQRVFSL